MASISRCGLEGRCRELVERDPVWQIDRGSNQVVVSIAGKRFPVQACDALGPDFANAVWVSSIMQAELLVALIRKGLITPSKSVELGSGCSALPSRVLKPWHPAMHLVCITDRSNDILVGAKDSIDRSRLADKENLVASVETYIEFDWHASLPTCLQQKFDLILGADLVYNRDCHHALLRSIIDLIGQSADPESLATQKQQSAGTQQVYSHSNSPLGILVHEERTGSHMSFMDALQKQACQAKYQLWFCDASAPPFAEMIPERKRKASLNREMRFVFISDDIPTLQAIWSEIPSEHQMSCNFQ